MSKIWWWDYSSPTIKNTNREYIMSKYWKTKTKNKNKKKKVSSPKIVERLDKFGRVSRFVNQVGSVPSTDTEMFGCEIVRNLPDYVNNFIKQIGYDVVIRVPRTNRNVLTGSGEEGDCHRNSKVISISFGGNRLVGLVVLINSTHTFFGSHSVWNTPENKTRCVTDTGENSDWGSHYDIPNTILFIPIGMNNVDKDKEFFVENLHIMEEDDTFFMRYKINLWELDEVYDNPQKYMVMRKDLERIIDKKGHPFTRRKKSIWRTSLEIIKGSHFGEVSSTTGRSWDYFRNKIINTYYPKVKV